MRRQALGAEAKRLVGRLVVAVGPRLGFGPTLAQPAQLLLERLGAALQVGNLRALGADGLFQWNGFAANFLAGNAGDFGFKEGCNVWHGRHCAVPWADPPKPV